MRSLFLVAVPLTFASIAFAQSAQRPDIDPRIAKIIASVSESWIQELVNRLARFATALPSVQEVSCDS